MNEEESRSGWYHADAVRVPKPEELDALWSPRRQWLVVTQKVFTYLLILGGCLLVWALFALLVVAIAKGDGC